MKKTIAAALLLLAGFLQLGCERDDICDSTTTPTTPRLIIEFYDYNAPAVKKNISSLALQAIDSDTIYVYNAVSKISVPLKTNADTVTFNLTLNSESTNPDLIYTDALQFNYSREDVYVSRACGFKTLFDLNNSPDLPNPYVLLDDPGTDWIRTVVVENYNLDSENETHIRIYF